MKKSAIIVINALHSGGAEKTSIELAKSLAQTHILQVVSLTIGGPAEQELRALGIRVLILGEFTRFSRLEILLRLARVIRAAKPDLIITFLYVSDLVGGLFAKVFAPRAKVYWNIRNNVLRWSQTSAFSFLIARVNGPFSRVLPDKVIYCSELAYEQHRKIGYGSKGTAVVANSSNSVTFQFSAGKRAMHRSLALCDDFVFLFVGRFDPVKRVDIYIEAAEMVARQAHAPVRFAIAGRGMDSSNEWLRRKIDENGASARFELLGHMTDQQALYSLADCLVVTSESEGSPNIVFEAIATALPTIIFATRGAEYIRDPNVSFIRDREIDQLVAEMLRRLEGKSSSPESRSDRASRVGACTDHPLVTFFRSELT